MANKDDFWTLNGSTAFDHLPGAIAGYADPVPICLQHGTDLWGAKHIGRKHAPFISQHSIGAPVGHGVPWVIWKKLQGSGTIWSVDEGGKLKITLPLAPGALLVLRLNEDAKPFFGITTIYTHGRAVDGINLGRYVGQKWPRNGPLPTFLLPP